MQRRPLLLSALLLSLCPALLSQASSTAPDASHAIDRARALYYTPVDHGLQSFQCGVSFDWKTFIEKASHQPVAETDARLVYLRTIQLSVHDDLHGKGELRWLASTPAPEGNADAIGRMRDGLQQLWSGFFQSWNGFVTGEMVTVDPAAKVEATPDGFRMSARSGSGLAEELFDRSLVLQAVNTSTTAVESSMLPHFEPSAQGLLLTSIHSTYRQPPTAAPTTVDMQVGYAVSNGFELPSSLTITAGPALFAFTLANCTVNTQSLTH